MEEEKVDVKIPAQLVGEAAPSAVSAEDQAKGASAEDVKTDPNAEVEGAEEKKPWHEDPRFKADLGDLKTLKEIKETYGYESIEEVRKAMDAFKFISEDADFATFLAFKSNKERLAEKKEEVDFSKMTAREFAEYNRSQAEDAARSVMSNEREALRVGDKLTADLKEFVNKVGVTEEVFKKEYAPLVLAHYEKIPDNLRDTYIVNNPPVNVFKLLYFDKAKEAGVKEYKSRIDESKKANFEEDGMGGNKGKPKDDKSQFEENWNKMFGNAKELPLSSFERK